MMTPPPHVHQIRLASAERHWHGRQDCAASVFKMAFAGRGTSEFQVFSNVLQDRRPGSSRVTRLIATRWLYTWLYTVAGE